MTITKKEVLDNLDEVKKYIEEAEQKKEEKVFGITIRSVFGTVLFQSTKTTWKEAVEEANLSEADLSGADLSEANLSEADLREADLRGANLCLANLSGADLCLANLRGADLFGANLFGAELNRATFYGKGGTVKLTKSQVPVFLEALGFVIED